MRVFDELLAYPLGVVSGWRIIIAILITANTWVIGTANGKDRKRSFPTTMW